MRNVLLGFLLICFVSTLQAQYSIQDFSKLSALEGSWTMNMKGRVYLEEWKKLNDSLYINRTFILEGKDSIRQEQVELKFSKGVITYSPLVYNQNEAKPVRFILTAINRNNDARNEYVFENPLHDFPQQIIYQPNGDSLNVIIKGTSKGVTKEVPYNFTRVKKS